MRAKRNRDKKRLTLEGISPIVSGITDKENEEGRGVVEGLRNG